VNETELPVGWTDPLKSFVDLDPKNARAHDFYAIAKLAVATSQLKIAVDLDPRRRLHPARHSGVTQGDLPGCGLFAKSH
jgi:hypothetical protein